MTTPSPARYRALITGASRGIGHEIAVALAPLSDLLILVGRDRNGLETLSRDIAPSKSLVLTGDLTDPGFLAEISRAVDGSGGINLVVNNAGVSGFSLFQDQPSDHLHAMLETNLYAPMRLTQLLLPSLLDQHGAQVVNIGSAFSTIGHPGFAAYCATKFGLRGFTEALNRELSPQGVRVRIFSPRATTTAINSNAVQRMNREFGVQEDDPRQVAREFIAFLGGSDFEYRVGKPERFFSKLNQLFPSVVGRALSRRMPAIQKILSTEEGE